jgi:hypothetical protein
MIQINFILCSRLNSGAFFDRVSMAFTGMGTLRPELRLVSAAKRDLNQLNMVRVLRCPYAGTCGGDPF